jgi:DNA-binding MarR family transcriptional regulator
MYNIPRCNLFVKHDLRQLQEFVKLPFIIVRTFGPRALTLSALATLPEVRDKGCTFRRIESIAEFAGLPVRTVKRHLQELEQDGAIDNAGRHHKRTATRIINPDILAAYESCEFAPLPRLALCDKLAWSEKTMLAYCCYKSFRFAGESAPAFINVAKVERELGLTRKSVGQALHKLASLGLIFKQGEFVELLL